MNGSVYKMSPVKICGIDFNVRHAGRFVYVESPQWKSFVVFDSSTTRALTKMLEMICEVAPEYMFTPDDELSGDAIELKRFLIEKLLSGAHYD